MVIQFEGRSPARQPHGRRWATSILATLLTLVVVVLGSAPVLAHTGFESSSPADGDSVDQPVEVVTIAFTAVTTPVADGFAALNAQGVIQAPVSVDTVDDMSYDIRFDPPLAGGDVGIRWSVQALDGHVLEGSFAFSVAAPLPTTTVPTISVAAPLPPTTVAASADPSTTATPAADDAAVVTTESSPSTTVSAEAVAATDGGAPPDASAAAANPALDEFLAVDDTRPGDSTALVGRILGLLGVAGALGGIAFALTAWRGPRPEIRRLLALAAGFAAVLAVGSVVEYVGVARIGDESLGAAWNTSAGLATVLRVVGGIVLVVGLWIALRRGDVRPVGTAASPRPLSAAVIDDLDRSPRTAAASPTYRWAPAVRAWPLGVGVVLVLASFWFDGHTVSQGPRLVHSAVNTVHVAAGSVWVGGLVSLCVLAWWRSRRQGSAGISELVVRFSRIATVALVAVVVAGVVMAVFVLDSFAELTGTDWGRTLLIKTAAVMVAVLLGAYNHVRMVPALEADPESPQLAAQVRTLVTIEAVVLVVVVVVTAFLVAAAT